ncbi:hypothetical protein Dde_0979 [Oleidesulfovibrio alaskensis G20]|uniref:Cell division protein ZapA n=1 Tax=Oleidesulfovibrio alaskensis (strain ATCC BAA-1058 / DSM 17464 / G20) TaxID=207559 RepID=Q313W6_OLEA2|nr:hypothetical protein Dde_0979 [Oleidesulfovibrio alaskensis G20]
MRSYNLSVLGLEVSFKAEADPQRVEQARQLVEERYNKLKFHGKQLSKEKLLTFLVLGLADDLLQSNHQHQEFDKRLAALLAKIDEHNQPPAGDDDESLPWSVRD